MQGALKLKMFIEAVIMFLEVKVLSKSTLAASVINKTASKRNIRTKFDRSNQVFF